MRVEVGGVGGGETQRENHELLEKKKKAHDTDFILTLEGDDLSKSKQIQNTTKKCCRGITSQVVASSVGCLATDSLIVDPLLCPRFEAPKIVPCLPYNVEGFRLRNFHSPLMLSIFVAESGFSTQNQTSA